MAEIIAKAMNDSDVTTECKSVETVKADTLPDYDAVVIGSPCYYGQTPIPLTSEIPFLARKGIFL